MGCLCFKLKKNRAASESIIKENILSINKITRSKYFMKNCKIKIEFLLINKNKIQVDIVNK